MKTNSSVSRTVVRGFVKGFLAPLTAVYIGQSASLPKTPSINVNYGSFASDLENIGSDFKRAIDKYGNQKTTRKNP